MHNDCAIRREQWRLRVMEAERDALFDEIATEVDVEATRAIADGDADNVGSSGSFAPRRNDQEAGPSTSVLDLTSTGDVHGHTTHSGEE